MNQTALQIYRYISKNKAIHQSVQQVVTLTWTTATLDANNNDKFTNWTIKERTLLYEDFAATFIPTSVILIHSLDQPYLIKDHILNAGDISYHMRKLLIHDGKYKSSAAAAAC